jgi:hypothetical protein
MLFAQDVFEKISTEAIHEEGQEIYHSGLLFLHAEQILALEDEDAVILFQRFEIRWTDDGRLVQTTRRSVLIRTEYGLDHFADLRIPWDSARQELTVQRLRTLRLSDGVSIDAGPTAIVETLPYAVDRAPDYCHLRETMLLHDGVELPCVLETVWTIEDTEPFRPGASGMHGFMGPEPAIDTQFALTLPAGIQPVIETAGGAPQPATSTDADGRQTWTFEMKELAAAPHPDTEESIYSQPRVSWSTWKDWESLAADLEARVASGAVIDDELREAFEEKLNDVRTTGEKARLVAEFIDQTTRLIDLDIGWWPEPRRAPRTWATGFGHRVDRAVLAAALYREAGFTARTAFRGRGYGTAGLIAPDLSWSEGVSLEVGGDGVDGWFDPESARFTSGDHLLHGRTVWVPLRDDQPVYQEADQPDRMAVRFDLAFDAEKQAWAGSGVMESGGTFSSFHRMRGLGTEALDFLNGFVGAIIGGAKVTACNPERFDTTGVTMGFALEVPAGVRDAQGRLAVELASFPAEHFVTLGQEHRESDVYLPAPVDLQYEIRLEPGDLETVCLPAATRLENGAGRWLVETSQEEKRVVVVRHVELPRNHYPAAQWPELRTLLIACENRAGRLLLFK